MLYIPVQYVGICKAKAEVMFHFTSDIKELPIAKLFYVITP